MGRSNLLKLLAKRGIDLLNPKDERVHFLAGNHRLETGDDVTSAFPRDQQRIEPGLVQFASNAPQNLRIDRPAERIVRLNDDPDGVAPPGGQPPRSDVGMVIEPLGSLKDPPA